MSLKFVETKGLPNTGIGYKMVRQVDVNEFIPYFYHFLRGGFGGLPPNTEIPPFLKPVAIKTRTIYRFYETTRVKADRFARALNGHPYPAGIHFWFERGYAEERFRSLQVLDSYSGTPDPNLVLVKFRWTNPVAFDENMVVALAGIPLQIMEITHLKEGSTENE